MARLRIHYGWLVVAVAFLAMLCAAGVRAAPGVFILPFEQEFGWGRPVVSLSISINLVLFGLFGPFAAAIMERIGMRAVMAAALLLMATAVGLTTLMTTEWQLHLLWGLLVGLGSGSLSGWVAATVSTRWFFQQRGMVVAILTVTNAAGQLIFLPLLAAITETAGWRLAAIVVSGSTLVAIPLIVAVIRNYPQDVGLSPYGAPPGTRTPAPILIGNPFQAAIDTLRRTAMNRDFLLLSGTFFICGASTSGLIATHLIPASHDHGIPQVVAASMLAVIGVFNGIGVMISGWLSDRFDNRRLLAWYYSLRGLSLIALPYLYGGGMPTMALFVVFYGLDWIATVPPTVRLTADLFGRANTGRVYAWIFAVHQLGGAMAAYGAGALRHWQGSYTSSFILAGALCLMAATMAMRIARPAPARLEAAAIVQRL
jgi:MFS family permease